MERFSNWRLRETIDNVREYELDNGLRVLLLPDPSRPTVTVNITFLVGSRVERHGEFGMAHLLEHMMFKGTPSFPDLPAALRQRGAQFNGTTWYDRTHYYETLPSLPGNLEFALQLESERMSQTVIKDEELVSEIGVVRNELLRGENSPRRVLFQRVMAAAYPWHGYGRPTIGLLDELKQMTPERVRAFQRDHYGPENTVLAVGGDFELAEAIDLVQRYFGSLDRGASNATPVEWPEPAQDGERQVTLRRVSEVGSLLAAYHIPAGHHHDLAAMQLLALILTMTPTGRLYRELVKTGLASSVSGSLLRLRDPGLCFFSAEIPAGVELQPSADRLFEIVEGLPDAPIDELELSRAKNEVVKRFDYEMADTSRMTVALSDWLPLADWRQYFCQAKLAEEVTPESLAEVAGRYLQRANRTEGRLQPQPRDSVVEIPAEAKRLNTDELEITLAEPGARFDPSPAGIAKAVEKWDRNGAVRIRHLARQTRGGLVSFLLHIRYGNERSLVDCQAASSLLPAWLIRGSNTRDHVQVQDELRRMRSWLRADSFRGGMIIEGQCKRSQTQSYLQLVTELLRRPRWDENEFKILQNSSLAALDRERTQPASLSMNELSRRLAPFPAEDVRYVRDLGETREQVAGCTADVLKTLYQQQVSAASIDVAVVGDADVSLLGHEILALSKDWTAPVPYERIAEGVLPFESEVVWISLPDKSNVSMAAGISLDLHDADPEYPPLLLANHLFGGSALTSRLGLEVRKKRGLSYSINSSLYAHAMDRRGRMSINASTNPEHVTELVDQTRAQLNRLVADGVTEEELNESREGMLQIRRLARAKDRTVAGQLANLSFVARDYLHHQRLDDALAAATVDEVNQAIRQFVDPERFVFVLAGERV